MEALVDVVVEDVDEVVVRQFHGDLVELEVESGEALGDFHSEGVGLQLVVFERRYELLVEPGMEGG